MISEMEIEKLNKTMGTVFLNPDQKSAPAQDFEERLYRALFGEELVRLLGGNTLADLDRQGKLFTFLNQQRYQRTPLINRRRFRDLRPTPAAGNNDSNIDHCSSERSPHRDHHGAVTQ